MFAQFLETVAIGDRERRVCRAKGCDGTWQARPCCEESLLSNSSRGGRILQSGFEAATVTHHWNK